MCGAEGSVGHTAGGGWVEIHIETDIDNRLHTSRQGEHCG